MILHARQARVVAKVVPPTAMAYRSTAPTGLLPVECRKSPPVIVVVAETSVAIDVTFILERVAGVSTVPSHFQLILGVELIADLERPVLR